MDKAQELSSALNVPVEKITEQGEAFVDGLFETMNLLEDYLKILGVNPEQAGAAPAEPQGAPAEAPMEIPAEDASFMPQ